MTRYLLVDKKLGFFLGTFYNAQVFSSNEQFDAYKAFSFESEEQAKAYAQKNSVPEDCYFILPIETKDTYVHVFDIIKAGYGMYTFNMINGIDMPSLLIH